MLTHYADSAHPFPLWPEEEIAYSVLARILRAPCRDIYTDDADTVVCLSTLPFPVWVLSRTDDPQRLDEIAKLLHARFPLEEGYRYVIDEALLQKLAAHDASLEGAHKRGMLSYRLDALADATHLCDGFARLAQMDELEAHALRWQDSSYEMERVRLPIERCRESVREKIEQGQLLLWVSDEGKTVAQAAWREQAPYGCVSGVYTLPEYRRRGYAMNAVHAVTRRILEAGFTPILYTDETYAASNACYVKLGYRRVARLCSVWG